MDNKIESLNIKGIWKFVFTDVNTGEIRTYKYENIICDTGRIRAAQLFVGESVNPYNSSKAYMAVGTGVGTPAVTDTALFNEPGGTNFRILITDIARVNNIITYHAYYGTGDAIGNISESGLFCVDAGISPADNIMLNHLVYSPAQPKTDTSTLDVYLEVQF